MKRLFLTLILVTGCIAITTQANAQVYVRGHFGVRFPIHRAYYAPQVVYSTTVPAPYYDDGVELGANVYNTYPVYHGYPVFRHYYGRGFYRQPRVGHFRRW